ncbi:MAG: CoA pyrophosphatase [Anaerolineae bacterium]|nr:CoA pyrophosphatase [Anaerolineae bacterium]
MISQSTVSQALHLPGFDGVAAQGKMKPLPRATVRSPARPGSPRQGAVLLLLYPCQQETCIVLTRRRDDLQAHAGQISFPGGRRELLETPAQAALREAHEEIGIDPATVQLLGELTPLYIPPSDFEVHPFVGWHEQPATFCPQPSEVAELLEVPLQILTNAKTRQEEVWNQRGLELQVPYFSIGPHKVWGATAMILSEFVERLCAVSRRAS